MLGKKLSLDLGTASLRVAVRGEGPAFSEPTVVAFHRTGGCVAAGLAAAALDGEPDLRLIRPMREGGIADRDALAALLQHAVNRAAGRQRIFRPDVVVAVSPAMTDAGRLTILDIFAELGTRTAYLIESPFAAAIGAGHSLTSGRGHLVADIGAGTVDVACLASEGTVGGRTLRGAGDTLRAAVAQRLEENHGVPVAAPAAADVIASLACVGPHEERRMLVEVPGSAEPVRIASTEIADLVDEHGRRIAGATEEVIREVPRELADDIQVGGLTLCGGGARLEGLDRYLRAQIGCPVRVAADPQSCTIRGTQTAAENLDVLRRSFMYIR
ncbi:MAG: rod shape-determining protein [Candidatus Dormibacteria bacterium]